MFFLFFSKHLKFILSIRCVVIGKNRLVISKCVNKFDTKNCENIVTTGAVVLFPVSIFVQSDQLTKYMEYATICVTYMQMIVNSPISM